ncbi:MAG: hypothetical protein QM730_20755 [Anaerolineales bacterium]
MTLVSFQTVSWQARRLTPRAADLGYAPRYFEFFLGWKFSPFRRRVHAPTPSG